MSLWPQLPEQRIWALPKPPLWIKLLPAVVTMLRWEEGIMQEAQGYAKVGRKVGQVPCEAGAKPSTDAQAISC